MVSRGDYLEEMQNEKRRRPMRMNQIPPTRRHERRERMSQHGMPERNAPADIQQARERRSGVVMAELG